MSSTHYRADVDGLRAVAIILIIAFHVGIKGVEGGFIGVDVFFVISGFLISSILIHEIERTDSIRLLDFYARRVRRLLPALFVVVMSTLIWAAIVWTPIENPDVLANSAIATATYLSNFYFWKNTGYFDTPAAGQPLLHTWSLAVEEQFYLIWPLLLLAVLWVARKRNTRFVPLLISAFVLVLLISFGLSVWGTTYRPAAAFYLMPTRAWEFAIGALVAAMGQHPSRWSHRVGGLLSWTGVTAIVVSAFTFSEATPFPDFAALIPALGTAFVIAGGIARPDALPTQFLGSWPMVKIGLLSYAWYLWHWPLLVFARVHGFSEPTVWLNAILVLLALGLAWATQQLVENPIRLNKPGPFRTTGLTLIAGVAGSTFLVAAAIGLKAINHELSTNARFASLLRAQTDWAPAGPTCHQGEPFTNLVQEDKCWQGSVVGPRKLLVWGDSHADTLVPLAAHFGSVAGISILQRTATTCPPILGVGVLVSGKPVTGCTPFNDAVGVEAERLSKTGLTGVILAARWSAYINKRIQFPENKWSASLLFDAPTLGDDAYLQMFKQSFRATLTTITKHNLRVLVVAPIPELRLPAPRCLAHNIESQCSTARVEVESYRNAAVSALKSVILEFPEVRFLDPISQFCDQLNCRPTFQGTVAYYDDNHISASTSRALLPWAANEFNWLIASPDNAPIR